MFQFMNHVYQVKLLLTYIALLHVLLLLRILKLPHCEANLIICQSSLYVINVIWGKICFKAYIYIVYLLEANKMICQFLNNGRIKTTIITSITSALAQKVVILKLINQELLGTLRNSKELLGTLRNS